MRYSLACVALLCMADALPGQTVPIRRGTVDLTIGGSDEARTDYLMEDVNGLAMDRAGRLFVADQQDHRVRVFSPRGELLFAFGRKGAGPGDLADPCCLAFAPNGDLVVKEYGNHRYSVFVVAATKATFRHSITFSKPFSNWTDGRITFDRSGRIYDVNGLPFREGRPTGLVRTLVDTALRVWRTDTFPTAPADSLRMAVHVTRTAGGVGTSGVGQPKGPSRLEAFGDDGASATATSSRYAVTLRDGTGQRIALLQRAVTGPPLTEQERASAQKVIDRIEAQWKEKLPWGVPDRRPPLERLLFDLDGRLWVVLSTPAGTPGNADLYDRNGTLVERREWPGNVRLLDGAIRGNTALALAFDADNAGQVVRLIFK